MMNPQDTKAIAKAQALELLGLTLAGYRDDAIKARADSGIEQDWREDEEFYQGYDDANRHEFRAQRTKPTEGGSTARTDQPRPTGSTVFPNLTQPYVDAASARVGDMLMPTDDRNFVFDPTPIPELVEFDDKPKAPTQPAQMPGGGPPHVKTPAAQAMADAMAKLQSMQRQAEESAKRAQQQVDDWLTECQYHAELRKVIDDSAKLGSGVMKGPVPVMRRSRAWMQNDQTGKYELLMQEKTVPASFRVDPWNLFPSSDCGEDIHNGSRIFERDYLSAKELGALRGGAGAAKYLDDQIDAAIKEGPGKRNETGFNPSQTNSKEMFEIWYMHGELSATDLETAGCVCEDPDATYHVKMTMVNDRVIKAALNPLPDGEFPYDVLPWKRRPGMPWGTGVARQGRTAQRMLVAATRNLMDNAGASAKPHKVVSSGVIQDGDPWTWRMDSDSGIDANRAMTFFIQPSMQAELSGIIQMAEKRMEMDTGMPMILMGMQGDVQETAKGRTIQNNNGTAVLRRIARLFDSCLTEPHMRRYHAWLMEYVEDDTMKGDFVITARGSSALVERDIQNQQIPTIMQMSLNPAFEMSPKRTRDEWLKSLRFDPSAFDLTDEEKEAMAQRQPPPPPQIAAAQIRAQSAEKVAQLREQGQTQRAQMELQAEDKNSEAERALQRMAIEVDAQLGVANLSAEERMALNDAKVSLSGIAMKLKTQAQLSAGRGGEAITPAVEPPGRAADGQSFVQ